MRVHIEGAEVVRGRRCLRIASWDISSGGRSCIAGPSGCGKTTALHLMSGLLVPERGRVAVGKVEVSSLREAERDAFRARHVGYVFQDFNLLPELTAEENVVLPQTLAGQYPEAGRRRAKELLEQLGVSGERDVTQLSRGERQRVAVARALAASPTLVLADEPTASLDPQRRDEVLDLLFGLTGTATLVVVSHDPAVHRRFEDCQAAEALFAWSEVGS